MTTRQTILGSTIRDTLGHYMSSGGGGGPVSGPPAMVSIEKVILNKTTSTTAVQDLTKDQNWQQCVPFVTLAHDTIDDGSHGSEIDGNLISVEMYDNAGTAAVRLRIYTASNGDRELAIYVVEFHSDISIQRIAVDRPDSANWTEAITAVDQTKAFIIPTFHSKVGGAYNQVEGWAIRVKFDSNTLIGCVRNSGAGFSMAGHIYVVEDKSAGNDFFTVQTASKSSAATTSTQTITSIDMDTTMLVGTFWTPATYGLDDGVVRFDLQDATTVRFRRFNTTNSCHSEIFIVTFLDGTAVQRGNKTISTGTAGGAKSYTQSITNVDVTKSIIKSTNLNSMGVNGVFTVASQMNFSHQPAKLTLEIDGDGNGFTARNRDSTQQEDYSFPWEVVEFA